MIRIRILCSTPRKTPERGTPPRALPILPTTRFIEIVSSGHARWCGYWAAPGVLHVLRVDSEAGGT